MRQLRLEVTSDPAHLAPVRRAVEAFCESAGFNAKATGDVGLVVNEAMANVTRHAYHGATDRPVRVVVDFADDELTLSVRDWGIGRDPSGVPPKADPLTPGGLGMTCLRSLMDQVTFTPQTDGMLLTMKKRRPQVE